MVVISKFDDDIGGVDGGEVFSEGGVKYRAEGAPLQRSGRLTTPNDDVTVY